MASSPELAHRVADLIIGKEYVVYVESQDKYVVYTSKRYCLDAILLLLIAGFLFAVSILTFFGSARLIGAVAFAIAFFCVILSWYYRLLFSLRYVFSDQSLKVCIKDNVLYRVQLSDYSVAYFLRVLSMKSNFIVAFEKKRMTLPKQCVVMLFFNLLFFRKPRNNGGVYILIRQRDYEPVRQIVERYIRNLE